MSNAQQPEEGLERLNSAELPEDAERQGLGSQAESAEQGAQSEQRTDITQELQELGQHLETAFRSALSAIRQRAQSADIEQRARKAAQQVQEAPLVRELESALVSGLHELNQRLRRVVERMDTREEAGTASSAGAETQRLTIERDADAAQSNAPASEEQQR